ncbi:retrovirus-related pol polyprotein from transposon TNT 1-94 [Tanacetum coccineum]
MSQDVLIIYFTGVTLYPKKDVLITVMNSMSLNNNSVNMEMLKCYLCEKCLNLDAELSKSKQAYNALLKSHSQLEKHCISLEVSNQLNQEIFQKDESCINQNALEIPEYFEKNNLKAQLQDKDTAICKLKDIIKSIREKSKDDNVNNDLCELETKNVELENSVAKLLYENERLCKEINHLKQVFKDQFVSIKKTRVRTKEQSDSLIDQLNLKTAENEDLKAQIQDKVFVITSLKNDLRKLKGKEILENVVHIPSANIIAPGMFKLDLEPLPPRLLHNKEVHIDYLRNTQEQANILREIVEQAKAKQPLDGELDLALERCSTRNCRSKPPGNKKNDMISQTPSRNKKNKVEAQPRKFNNSNRVVKLVCDVDVKHSLSNTNSKILYDTCNKSMFDGVHDKCLLDLVQNGNNRTKSAKKHRKQNVWKPTGHVFTEVGFKWKPTGKTLTIVGNSCPLTRFTSTNIVPPKQTTSYSDEIQKPEIKVYSRKPKNVKNIGSSKIAKIVESKNANHSEPNQTWGSNATNISSSSSLVMTVFPDLLCQFCDADLEVAFWKNTCFIRNLEGVGLLSGSRDTSLYKISLDDMLKSSPIYLLSRASKTKIWLWHRRLSHLNFGTLNKLAKDGLAGGIPRLKFQKDHLFLKTKDEAPAAIIKCIKNIQVRLKAKVRNVRIDNGTKFVNRTLREWYENVGIMHQTSVACTPQQNGAKAINTACYTQNHSLIRLRYNKTPHELMQDKKPDLSFFHVFGSVCYPSNDNEDLGKFDAKADIGIFISYAPAKKAFKIYNRMTRIITETIHVTFDELTTMTSE